jgi:hypothetical protein
VLANVVIGTSLGVDPRETLETTVWHILLVQTPGDTLVLEQVDNRRNICGNLGEWVTVKTEVITEIESANEAFYKNLKGEIPANCRHVIRFTRVGDSK